MPYAPDLAGCALDGRYELHELIGEGTFGRVYRGHDRRLARGVAIKVIKPWWAEDPDWAESFEREAQLLARVSDPGIVQIFDVGQADEGLYYVTELVDGESLASRLRAAGRLDPWEAREIAEQLCRALEHAHAQHIVHRDIKPANVLISTDGRVKVGDLGIARLAEGSTDGGGTATIAGTPRYMAPEQASGLPTSPTTDIYSAGIVLYEMLAGRPPFTGDSAVEVAMRHVQEAPPPLPPATPESLVRVVRQALAKDPAARFQSAAEMADALARSRSSERFRAWSDVSLGSGEVPRPSQGGVEATWVAPKFSPRRTVNPGARRRTIAAFVLVLVVLGGMVAAAVALRGPDGVKLPALRGLNRAAATARLKRLHLRASFASRYSQTALGTAVAQSPAAGVRVKDGATVRVVLSAGPPPVPVPDLAGEPSSTAVAQLRQVRLNASVTTVPDPGGTPGTVARESPAAGKPARVNSTVALFVAQAPQWRPLTSLSGSGSGQSVPFRIRGDQWRIVYTMSYQGTCDFVFFCNGPNARVLGLGTDSTDTSFGLNDGGTQTRVFQSGPGLYQIAITPGWDSARWSLEVEDYY
jgi:hypothetical protein